MRNLRITETNRNQACEPARHHKINGGLTAKTILSFVTILSFILVGCSTSNVPYRRSLPVPNNISPADINRPADQPVIDPVKAFTIETNENFKIGYVEFDDQGWFWAHQQWEDVKSQIAEDDADSTNGLTIVVFVHGWKNNADYADTNVQMFHTVLADLSRQISPRKVFGVYVGWRGWSVKSDYFPIPAGEELSFYHRKDVAARIGHQGSATQMFTELEMMKDDFNDTNLIKSIPRTELVIIGHSFGGQLVYSAVSQVLTERLLMTTRHKEKPLQSFGDLVILVNPAFEASLYNNLISLATSDEITYPTNQRPALAIFESKGDTANGFWFPLGRHLSTWYEKTRPSKGPDEEWLFNVRKRQTADEENAILTTVGFDKEYITYDLNYTNYGTNFPFSAYSYSGGTNSKDTLSPQNALATNSVASDPASMLPYIFTDSLNNTNFACILQPRTNTNDYRYKPRNPFLNVAVDTQIMRDHNDIDNPIFLRFLRDFILFTLTNSPNEYLDHPLNDRR